MCDFSGPTIGNYKTLASRSHCSLLEGISDKVSGLFGPAICVCISAFPAQASPSGGLFIGALPEIVPRHLCQDFAIGGLGRSFLCFDSVLFHSQTYFSFLWPLRSIKKMEPFVQGSLAVRDFSHLYFHLILAWCCSTGRMKH
jgi:hypothetical protein